MNTKLSLLPFLLIALCSRAHADNWGFTLDNTDQSGLPNSTLTYSGSLTNTTGTDLPLLGLTLSPPAGSSTADYTIDFTSDFQSAIFNTGYIIPTSGYTGSIFSITFSPTASPGLIISGSLDILTDIPGDPPNLIQNFGATVTSPAATPAPSALVTVLIGAVPGLLLLRRRQK